MSHPTRQLFGTDGIRGVAGEFPLTYESTFAIGKALGHDLTRGNAKARVVIGQDTRQSSAWIADRVTSGLASAGVVISASHNPWTDNGIKVFSGNGYKLPDERELAIEQEIFALLEKTKPGEGPTVQTSASLPGDASLREAYIHWLAHSVTADLSKMRVLVDCANGAATAEAPGLFRTARVRAEFLHSAPDGKNINEQCGALHPATVAGAIATRKGDFDLGITFDGDADRALFSDANGNVVNGDAVLLIAGRDMQARGALVGNTIVATTMSNMGLEVALKRSGIAMLRANVGDKYVLEEMLKTGATLGGEQSGHILFRDGDATTGDGLLTALRLMEIMARSKKSLTELASDMKVFPQTIQNVRVREKVPFAQVPAVQASIVSAERELDGNGRVVVRYSGTEALARVMVEAESEEKMKALASWIAGAIKKHLGA